MCGGARLKSMEPNSRRLKRMLAEWVCVRPVESVRGIAVIRPALARRGRL